MSQSLYSSAFYGPSLPHRMGFVAASHGSPVSTGNTDAASDFEEPIGWSRSRCPTCGGNIHIVREVDGMYARCLQCSRGYKVTQEDADRLLLKHR